MRSKLILVCILLLLFTVFGGSQQDFSRALSLLDQTLPTPSPQPILGITEQTVLVTKVIDGDTIEIEGGQKVRYIGIDTPELKGNECFAKEAKNKNKELVDGKRVTVKKDISETDKYGRLLRYVYTAQGEFINDILVKEGFATIATYPPDVAKQNLFRASQQEAISHNRGLWDADCNSD